MKSSEGKPSIRKGGVTLEETGSVTNISNLLRQYSFDDLAKSFFALSLWLPNISSQIKLQYLYTLL